MKGPNKNDRNSDYYSKVFKKWAEHPLFLMVPDADFLMKAEELGPPSRRQQGAENRQTIGNAVFEALARRDVEWFKTLANLVEHFAKKLPLKERVRAGILSELSRFEWKHGRSPKRRELRDLLIKRGIITEHEFPTADSWNGICREMCPDIEAEKPGRRPEKAEAKRRGKNKKTL